MLPKLTRRNSTCLFFDLFFFLFLFCFVLFFAFCAIFAYNKVVHKLLAKGLMIKKELEQHQSFGHKSA